MTTTVLAFIPSPSQGVWHLFGVIPLRAYALCIIAGIVAALVLGDRRWVARGGEQGVIYDIALWAVPFGLIGGRLYHVMTDWPKYFGADGAGFLAALRIWDGGLGIWGAVALGGVGAWIACRRRDIPLPAFGDAIAPGIVLAQAIGRLGNYFNQELYGRETDLPWGLTIWERLDPSGVVSPHSLDGVSTGQVYAVVHPTFLYELIWNLLVFALLIWADRRFTLGHGRLFALYVAGYCVGRFGVELMRSDTATLIAGIRINTFTSTFVFIGAVVYIMVAPKGREDPATLGGDGVDSDHESALDSLGEELTAVAATSGVVAAAKVAGDEDTPATSASGGDREASLGSVDGAEAVEAEDGAPVAHEAAIAAAAEPIVIPGEAPAVAVEGTEVAAALNAEVEPVSAEPAPAEANASAEPEDGLGSVDGDEVAEARDDASDVHDAAVTATEDAEALAADVAAEEGATTDVTAEPTDGLGSAGPDDATAADDAPPADDSTAEPEDGLGSVDGDEVAEARDDASDVHEAAVTATEDAEALAADVAAEDTIEDTSPADGSTVDDDSTTEPQDGLGSVDGDEVAEARDDASDVHDAAVTATEDAEALAADVADEEVADEEVADEDTPVTTTEDSTTEDSTTDDSTAEPSEGLGSVDPDEATAAENDAAEVHEAVVAKATDKPAEQPRRRWWRRG